MNRLESFKEKLAVQKATLGTTIANVDWSGLSQKIAAFPFDFLMFDIEHGTIGIEDIEESLRVCRLCDLPAIVRVPDSISNLISKTLDMGADGILLPRIEHIEQVETAVSAARYFPRGRKGCGGFSNLRPDDKLSTDRYNDNRLLFIQMESREGLFALPEILDRFKEEVSGVIIGPYDSSIMLGTPLDIASVPMQNYIREVFDTCAARKIASGIFVDNAAMIASYKAMGCNIFWTGTEISLLCEALNDVCTAFKSMTKVED
ncbi:MAG: aldolase/citrate lyase family protein [Clostridia bacterium]